MRKKCRVIPSGVDFSLFRPVDQKDARKRPGLSADKSYVLFAGSGKQPKKRFDLAEETVRMVRNPHRDVELLLVSGVPQDRLNLFYSAADCLALTSNHEGSPNVVGEALACNLPVVSVDVGDVRELCGGLAGCEIVDMTAESISRGFVRGARPRTKN